jgi:hypothetical protein
MINSEIIHCLKPLGIVKIEQRYVVFVFKMLKMGIHISYLFKAKFSVLSLRTLRVEFV